MTNETTQPSRRAVKLVGGVIVIAAVLAGVGYAYGFETFATWAQLAGSLISSLLM